MSHVAEYDASGLQCPLPLITAAKKLKALAEGEVLKVVATDPGTLKDMPALCRQNRHQLVEQTEVDGRYVFLIRR
jgi:tRNA 2-thiouridine synthesizing protein A